jgi:hypothetical protein
MKLNYQHVHKCGNLYLQKSMSLQNLDFQNANIVGIHGN